MNQQIKILIAYELSFQKLFSYTAIVYFNVLNWIATKRLFSQIHINVHTMIYLCLQTVQFKLETPHKYAQLTELLRWLVFSACAFCPKFKKCAWLLYLNFVQKSWRHFSYTKSYNNKLIKSYVLKYYKNSKPTFNQGHGQEMD